MGCDIHVVFQKKVKYGWQEIPHKYEENRHYGLFGWLADVRNGYGFAGIVTGEAIRPISQPRGLPEDFQVKDDVHIMPLWFDNGYGDTKAERREKWLGDHSHSWLLGSEILSAQIPQVWKTGIITLEEFRKWDGVSQPKEWCGDTRGPAIHVAQSPVLLDEKTTHVRIFWKMPADAFKYFTDEVQRLVNEHGEVRMVFGFDS